MWAALPVRFTLSASPMEENHWRTCCSWNYNPLSGRLKNKYLSLHKQPLLLLFKTKLLSLNTDLAGKSVKWNINKWIHGQAVCFFNGSQKENMVIEKKKKSSFDNWQWNIRWFYKQNWKCRPSSTLISLFSLSYSLLKEFKMINT